MQITKYEETKMKNNVSDSTRKFQKYWTVCNILPISYKYVFYIISTV